MADVVHLATSRESPAVRACGTCRYQRRVGFSDRMCGAVENQCCTVRMYQASGCGPAGLLWEPRPPRRSFARWIWDTMFSMGAGR